jgi:hypothetical protein
MLSKDTRADVYTKVVLTIIAVMLAVAAFRPVVETTGTVQAQGDPPSYYVEPGTISIRNPDGSSVGDGKMIINLRTGDVWGFPTGLAGAPYPVDPLSSKPAVSKAVHLGHFDLSAIQ